MTGAAVTSKGARWSLRRSPRPSKAPIKLSAGKPQVSVTVTACYEKL